ncbi:MAG: heavy metal-associated domain-containing protein [Mobiluncus porci]|uniref:Heavy-metal-associated domain-containing protein n=1 Tax=Mobiluncus porci TaxID=2652278 RepID=A0A7K0K261_9ACTO|nr:MULTISPECIES: heavy metal-associated domain-containing protein [Mobiluncus]MCI6583507.1 heavy-metal-associated domain-containing protein [Mobiluncus sp.]MDD7540885.1 heavy metal-associated domain-containing protein [Mobiluncus porci]MDY5748914.1 heavy metal-associated domain-containing protein [Mobiluncus porci]MST49150.1 heavy-metal-associated domain-containing protein [Mobiluncus porci]
MATLKMNLDGLTCGMCVKHITEDLSQLDGISKVEVVRGEGKSAVATVTGDAIPADDVLTETVQDAGDYSVLAINR